MLVPGENVFSTTVRNLTLLADTGDFFALIGGGTGYRLLELRVFQEDLTTLTMEALRIHRGTGGAGGTELPEYEYSGVGNAAPTVTAFSLPTTDVTTDDLSFYMGWNMLQEAVWLPTPVLAIPCKGADDIGITTASTTAHTGVGVTAVWAEAG